MTSQMNPLMVVEHLSKTFVSKPSRLGGPPLVVRAVNDVSFSIGERETLGLVGCLIYLKYEAIEQ